MRLPAWEVLRQTTEGLSGCDLDTVGVPPEALEVFERGLGRHAICDSHGLWLEPEDQHDGHTPDSLAITIGQRINELYHLYNGVAPQSPIEHRMAAALLWLQMDWAGFPRADVLGGGPKEHFEFYGESDQIAFYLTPQARIGKYRADFLLWFSIGKHHGGLVVECDGHAYHEKTKEQASRDKARDRELLAAGYPVMRFTGSEIYRDALACVQQVNSPLFSILHRVSKDAGLFA